MPFTDPTITSRLAGRTRLEKYWWRAMIEIWFHAVLDPHESPAACVSSTATGGGTDTGTNGIGLLRYYR